METTRAYESLLREQEHNRKSYEIEKLLKQGKRVALPIPMLTAQIINAGDIPTMMPMNDEIMYDHNTMSYKTKFQQIEIDNLNKIIKDKEKKESENQLEEKIKLENLIAYYYNR